jgi:hypothetical protein
VSTDALTPRDAEQLRMLVIGYYVVAVIQTVMGCMGILQLGFGALILSGPDAAAPKGGPNPVWMGWLFVAMAAFVMFVSWSLAVLLVVGARKLARRRGYLFCMVVAFFVAILNVPLGTALGACTLILLLRPSVKAAFEANG